MRIKLILVAALAAAAFAGCGKKGGYMQGAFAPVPATLGAHAAQPIAR